jgi:hypothetical protein
MIFMDTDVIKENYCNRELGNRNMHDGEELMHKFPRREFL